MTAITLKYNGRFKEVFEALGFVKATQENLNKAYKVYCKVLAGMKLEYVKKERKSQYIKMTPVLKKTRTVKQKRATLLHKDRINTAKQDMINHIQDLMDSGELTYTEFMNDPYVYFDSQIMGSYYNNNIIRKSIVKHFGIDVIPF